MYNPQYNNFSMPNNQPYNYFQNPYYRQQIMQQPDFSQTNTNKIFVSGVDDVKARQQPFNSDYFYLHNDEPILYQKVVDYKGQFEIKEFDITPRNSQISTKDKTNINTPTYIEKAEFDKICGELEQIKEQLSKIDKKGGNANVGTTTTTTIKS